MDELPPRTLLAHNGARIFGGAERWTVRLLVRLQERGHRVLLLCQDEHVGERARSFGIEAEVARLGGHASLHDALSFSRALARHRPDGLLLGTFKKTWLGGLGAALARVPRVIARVGLSTDLPGRRAVYRLAFRRWMTRVVANADGIRRAVLADLPGLDPRRVITLYNGVEPPPRRREPGALRRALGLEAGTVVLGAVARLDGQKRLDRLVRTLALLPERVHCVLAGDGPERPGLESLARAAGLSGRVHFIGHTEDVGDVLDALDLFVVTSRSEGMSNAMLEALSAGVPVVSTPVSGAAEALDPLADGRRPGVVARPDEASLAAAVSELLADPSRLGAMSDAARARALERFDAAEKTRKWEALLGGDTMAVAHEGPSPLVP